MHKVILKNRLTWRGELFLFDVSTLRISALEDVKHNQPLVIAWAVMV